MYEYIRFGYSSRQIQLDFYFTQQAERMLCNTFLAAENSLSKNNFTMIAILKTDNYFKIFEICI